MNKDTVSYVLLRVAEAESVGWKCLLEMGRKKTERKKEVGPLNLRKGELCFFQEELHEHWIKSSSRADNAGTSRSLVRGCCSWERTIL